MPSHPDRVRRYYRRSWRKDYRLGPVLFWANYESSSEFIQDTFGVTLGIGRVMFWLGPLILGVSIGYRR